MFDPQCLFVVWGDRCQKLAGGGQSKVVKALEILQTPMAILGVTHTRRRGASQGHVPLTGFSRYQTFSTVPTQSGNDQGFGGET